MDNGLRSAADPVDGVGGPALDVMTDDKQGLVLAGLHCGFNMSFQREHADFGDDANRATEADAAVRIDGERHRELDRDAFGFIPGTSAS
jgi:hypothetical protein